MLFSFKFRLEDACWLISLYHIINPTAKSKGKQYTAGDEVSFIKVYYLHIFSIEIVKSTYLFY